MDILAKFLRENTIYQPMYSTRIVGELLEKVYDKAKDVIKTTLCYGYDQNGYKLTKTFRTWREHDELFNQLMEAKIGDIIDAVGYMSPTAASYSDKRAVYYEKFAKILKVYKKEELEPLAMPELKYIGMVAGVLTNENNCHEKREGDGYTYFSVEPYFTRTTKVVYCKTKDPQIISDINFIKATNSVGSSDSNVWVAGTNHNDFDRLKMEVTALKRILPEDANRLMQIADNSMKSMQKNFRGLKDCRTKNNFT